MAMNTDKHITVVAPKTEKHGEKATATVTRSPVNQPRPERVFPSASVANTIRSTTITVVLRNIIDHDDFLHGGINE